MNGQQIVGTIAGLSIFGISLGTVINIIQDASPAVKAAAIGGGGTLGVAGGVYLAKKSRE